MEDSPKIAFSIGDPNGIGPEVLLKALGRLLPEQELSVTICGVESYLRELAAELDVDLPWSEISVVECGECRYPPAWGKVTQGSAVLAIESLKRATSFCVENDSALLVTPPVHKASLARAGFCFGGQTEFLADFFAREASMAFLSEPFHVLLLTTHLPLNQVSSSLKRVNAVKKCEQFYQALKKLDCPQPRIAVCGLNPHASEDGLFGDEEQEILAPVIQTLNNRFGEDVFHGPLPADTLFQRALNKEFHGVVANYHDQGLIPLKLVAFRSAANTTLGLPIIRTSPDHGTAFDIAGQGRADAGSMVAAIKWGLRLAVTR